MPLPILSEKRLPHAIAALELVAYCDPHDLVAIATPAHDVVVYRISGHVAFTVKRRDAEAEVTALEWKGDGGVLGVGWSDGGYGLYAGEGGKLLGRGSARAEVEEDELGGLGDEAVVRRFRWMRFCGGGIGKAGLIGGVGDDDGEGDFSADGNDIFGDGKRVADSKASIEVLTRSIATLDVTSVLPRLSAIPSHGMRSGPDGSRFASQAATDTVFESAKDEAPDGGVDTLVICSSDGKAHVLMDDMVKIGNCGIFGSPLLQASHANCESHAILSQTADEQYHLNTITLPLHTLAGPLLHVIAMNTKRIQTFLSYITQTIHCITHDYTTGLQFPSRLLANIRAELEEKQEGDLVTTLYHLALTGMFSETMKEWLVDIVKETNHKRWDQAVNTMYTNIQQHLFVHLKPALDRLSIATTILRRYARYHEDSSAFEVPSELFTKMLDGIDSLRIVSQDLLLVVMDEQREFKAFSKWLRVMIDIGVAGPGTKSGDETEAKENPNLEYPLLLKYVEHTMLKSKLARFLEDKSALSELSEMSYARTCEAVGKLHESNGNDDLQIKDVQDANALVSLPALAAYLSESVRVALERVTGWQSKMLTPPTSIHIPTDPETRVPDLQVHVQASLDGRGSRAVTRILLLPPETRHDLLLYSYPTGADARSPHEDLFEDQPSTYRHRLEVLNAKFHSPNKILVLGRQQTDSDGATYAVNEVRVSADGNMTPGPSLHDLNAHRGFVPESMMVGGREGKRVCLLFGNGGKMWVALDLVSLGRYTEVDEPAQRIELDNDDGEDDEMIE
ncbi:hypothetical protein LTR91_007074 [Friedmanniomyces endolithicus]|uniref:Anaphase-promoting complex subunit 4 n=1 Tax=Friedmanniomyces endolithicus TaxID=329885 RepID=A0AAN6KR58_9PEZI|nr:hypothetical protein LTR91_007074 [Friedmanniomyces endolithicus]KAK1053443.1 hypothetical protein LTS16_001200 [Friedmanniomyces endolithicus]